MKLEKYNICQDCSLLYGSQVLFCIGEGNLVHVYNTDFERKAEPYDISIEEVALYVRRPKLRSLFKLISNSDVNSFAIESTRESLTSPLRSSCKNTHAIIKPSGQM